MLVTSLIIIPCFYSVLRYKEAEQWCSLAMKFLPQLPESLCQNYKDQVSEQTNTSYHKYNDVHKLSYNIIYYMVYIY